MLSSTLLSPTQDCFQRQFKHATSRKLLGHAYVLFNQHSAPAVTPAAMSSTSAQESTAFSSLNANVVLILAVLLCALICALIVNTLVRCVCGVASGAWFQSEGDSSSDSVHPCASERQASARVRRKRAVSSLSCLIYTPAVLGVILRSSGSECAICLSDFAPGERVRVLPNCGHAFHDRCIDRWLASHSSCPTCRKSLFGHDEEAGHPAAGLGDSERVTE